MTDVNGRHTADSPTTTDSSSDPPHTSGSTKIDAIEADIERTREDLALTVDQLAAKLDVKSRVASRVSDTKDQAAARMRTLHEQVTDDDGHPTRQTITVAGALAAGIVVVTTLVLWRRAGSGGRRRRSR